MVLAILVSDAINQALKKKTRPGRPIGSRYHSFTPVFFTGASFLHALSSSFLG